MVVSSMNDDDTWKTFNLSDLETLRLFVLLAKNARRAVNVRMFDIAVPSQWLRVVSSAPAPPPPCTSSRCAFDDMIML